MNSFVNNNHKWWLWNRSYLFFRWSRWLKRLKRNRMKIIKVRIWMKRSKMHFFPMIWFFPKNKKVSAIVLTVMSVDRIWIISMIRNDSFWIDGENNSSMITFIFDDIYLAFSFSKIIDATLRIIVFNTLLSIMMMNHIFIVFFFLISWII